MKYLNPYQIFERGVSQYSIYDWFEDLKSHQWRYSETRKVNRASLEKWTEHFIGRGYWNKVESLTNRIWDALKKVDTDYITERMYDVYDNYNVVPSSKQKYVICAVAYGDYSNHDKAIRDRHNGLISVRHPEKDDNLYVIIHILKEIIYPTMFIGSPSVPIRLDKEQIFVTDQKWNCANFNIDNYSRKIGDEIPNGESGRRGTTNIYESNIREKKAYSVDKVLDMYLPCVDIEIGGHHDSYLTGKMNLKKLEAEIDKVLPSILPELDYKEVVFGWRRQDRFYDNDIDIYDYSLKILLNL